MLTPAELERIPVEIQKLMIELSMRIMEDVIDRINMINSISRTADYEIYTLSRLGLSSDTIRKAIQYTLQKTDSEIDKIYDEIIREGYARDENLYNATGKPFTRYDDNIPLQQLIEAVKKQTRNELTNITQSTAFRVESGNTVSYHTTTEYLKSKLDEAVMDIASGAFNYNKAIKDTIHEMTKSGVRVVEYESGWHNRIEVASRRAIMTGVTQVTGKINDMNAEALETDYFEVSWHATARPTHQVWQGRVYNRQQLIDICGLGTGPGLCGWNCYHSYYPFLPGISKRTYTDEQLDAMNAKENEKKAYRGKEYTTYEATQRQRQLETQLRKQRQDIKLMERAGASEDDIVNVKSRYRGTMAEYVDFSKEMGLPQQRERIYSDGLGRVGGGNRVANIGKNGIINVKSTTTAGVPNSITQVIGKSGGITRNYYNSSGKWYKQITNNDHGNRKNHPFGQHGEHAHDIVWEDGKIVERKVRELTEEERKENQDIL